jgi:putative flippase GtrA
VTVRDLVARLGASRFVRFGAVGGAGFFVNEAALFAAHRMMHAGPILSWFIAFVPAVTFTWWGNRKLTFADRASAGRTGMLAEWGRFVAANSVGAVANFAIYAGLTGFAPFPLGDPNLALAFGVIAGLVFNYTLSHHLVFRK